MTDVYVEDFYFLRPGEIGIKLWKLGWDRVMGSSIGMGMGHRIINREGKNIDIRLNFLGSGLNRHRHVTSFVINFIFQVCRSGSIFSPMETESLSHKCNQSILIQLKIASPLRTSSQNLGNNPLLGSSCDLRVSKSVALPTPCP